jgi:hypothetical protein
VVRRHPETGEQEYEKVSARDRIAIASVLADRGWGKAPQVVVIEDDDPPPNAPDVRGFAEDMRRAVEEVEDRWRRRNEDRQRRDENGAPNRSGQETVALTDFVPRTPRCQSDRDRRRAQSTQGRARDPRLLQPDLEALIVGWS